MGLYNRAADGETHAEAAGLGTEEGIKDAGQIRGRNSMSRVAHGHLDRATIDRRGLDR